MFEQTALPGVILVTQTRHHDDRGFLCETWHKARFEAAGIGCDFVQDNMSFSAKRGTLRGLHYQLPPHGQAKLISCPAGHLLDIAVDMRPDSPNFGRSVAIELSAENGLQMFLPAGFAHGFCTLADNTLAVYRLSNTYAPQAQRAIAFDDPELAIDWPIAADALHISERDRSGLSLAEARDELVGVLG